MEFRLRGLIFAGYLLFLAVCSAAVSNVSLELQGGNCSDQLTLICRHSAVVTPPHWILNGTHLTGVVLNTAFPGTNYTVESLTEHRAIISGVDNVQALDGNSIQCVYDVLGTIVKSNAVNFSFIPPDYQSALSLESFTANFSERLSTFTYSFQKSCSLYPRCTPNITVEHTVSPLPNVTNTSKGCTVEYTISNLTRCLSYEFGATMMFGNRRIGDTTVVGGSVMLSPGQFTITSVTIEEDCNLIIVTFVQNEPDCPGYPTERYTLNITLIDKTEVVENLTADEFKNLTINHTNGSVTLSLCLTKQLSEDAMTVNMTKFNTVPTNMSDDMGYIVTEMATWGTSDMFDLQIRTTPTGQTTPTPSDNTGAIAGGTVSVVLLMVGGGISISIVVIVMFKCFCKKNEDGTWKFRWRILSQFESEAAVGTSAGGYDLTPTQGDIPVDVGGPLPMPPEDNQPEVAESDSIDN